MFEKYFMNVYVCLFSIDTRGNINGEKFKYILNSCLN